MLIDELLNAFNYYKLFDPGFWFIPFFSKDNLNGEVYGCKSFKLGRTFDIEKEPVRERDKIGDNLIFNKSWNSFLFGDF